MSSDQRTYIKVHDGILDHPKVVGLSYAGIVTYLAALTYCSRYLTDGFLPAAAVKKFGTPRAAFAEVVSAGLVEPLGDDWEVHDYLEHQRSADEVADLRKKRQEAGSRGGIAKASAVANARDVAKQTASKNVAVSETDTENRTKAPSSATADALFAEFWSIYPRKVGKQDAEKVFHRQRRKIPPETIIAGAGALAGDPNLPEAQFIPHPATWLARGGWDDEPLPTVLGGRPVDQSVPEAWR